MAKEIKVSVTGTISEYNLKLFSERVAQQLFKKLGEENSRALLEKRLNSLISKSLTELNIVKGGGLDWMMRY